MVLATGRKLILLSKSKGIDFKILIDANSQIMRRYRILGLPATIIISSDGKVVKVHKSYKPGDEKLLEQEIVELLSKKRLLKKDFND